MRGASADARATLVEHLDEVLDAASSKAAATLGNELFAVAGLLDSEPGLRRAVTDPATPGEARAELIGRILGDRVSDPTAEAVRTAVARRWSASRDLADSLEHAGALAHVAAADDAGRLDEVEDELFRFGRIVAGNRELREVLGARSSPLEGRQQLVDGLLSGKATPETRSLAVQAAAGRHRSMAAGLQEFGRIAAQRRDRAVATVTVARSLTARQTTKLGDALAAEYGRQVHLNVIVDAAVLGGVRVEIGDEVVDGTMHTRLEIVRRRLTG